MKKPFSKQLLIADYIISILLILGYFVCVAINGLYTDNFVNLAIANGLDVLSVPQLLNLDGFSTMLSVWLGQLGVSSAAYYVLLKTEHRLQMSRDFVESLPKDIKENVDMTSVLTTALSTSDN